MTTPDDNLQKKLFREIIFDVEYNKIKRVPGRILDDVNFNNVKKISNILNDILYIVFTCDTLQACLSKHIKKAKLKRSRSF
jgi:hypothetical protein